MNKKDKKKRVIVTTALPYANGPLHLGHLAGTFLPADVFVRYERLKGTDVIWVAGSDEHGIPIILRAEKEGITAQQVVDRYYQLHLTTLQKFHASFDCYSRTSMDIHHKTVQSIFLELEKKGVFVKKRESQYYDPKMNMFLADRYLQGECPKCHFSEANGDQCENCGVYLNQLELLNPVSKLSGEKPILRETTHWYFPLGRFQNELQKWLELKKELWRTNVVKYTQTWLDDGLTDRAITRDIPWGVPLPLEGDDAVGKVLYVWFEAVIGYISATKEWATQVKNDSEYWKKYWFEDALVEQELIQFIGKDNIVFHTIMFPAILMALNEGKHQNRFILPNRIPASEFMNIEGKKISKSRGYAIYAHEFLATYPPDVLRYAIAVNYPENHDTDFSWKDFQNRVNGELADTLGNFVKRVIDFTNVNYDGKVPADVVHKENELLDDTWQRLNTDIEESFQNIHLKQCAFLLMEKARMANRYFTEHAPWKKIKTDPTEAAKTVSVGLNLCYNLAVMFYPLLPKTSEKIFSMLNVKKENIHWDEGRLFCLAKGHKIAEKSEALFSKIEDEIIEAELMKIEKLVNPPKTEKKYNQTKTPMSECISFDEFKKIDLRVGTILKAERVEKSDKLLKVQVKIGEHTRQIVSGIAMHYLPEHLVGKNVVVVANLEQRKIRGELSEGMILSVESQDGRLFILSPQEDGINGQEYFVLETLEAGIVLQGTEVKSIRSGKVSLEECYAFIKNGELWIENLHIAPYEQGNIHNHDPRRKRKALLHKKEIRKLHHATQDGGSTLVLTKLYFKKGKVKIELAVAKGKKLYDKRETIKSRDVARQIKREK
ncbi:hypothetical protein CHS0354_024185 [Potamilus streckersoni]|uniref:Methionine--tRNA ligase n=1 Tax=Potamilus streckersoni TaxID=2493646 RepID=A0AAE0VM34_9BIVA|nr:hypothetical protein CHS0354_024185 [Potamilus streckersoni]